jgi:hypothetical protein
LKAPRRFRPAQFDLVTQFKAHIHLAAVVDSLNLQSAEHLLARALLVCYH